MIVFYRGSYRQIRRLERIMVYRIQEGSFERLVMSY